MSKDEQGRKVKGNEPVTIVFTADGQNYKSGQKVTVHSVQAEKFIARGIAALESDAPKSERAGKK